MERRVRLEDEVGLPGDPKTVADEVVLENRRAFLVIRLVFNALLYLRDRVGVLRRAVSPERTASRSLNWGALGKVATFTGGGLTGGTTWAAANPLETTITAMRTGVRLAGRL